MAKGTKLTGNGNGNGKYRKRKERKSGKMEERQRLTELAKGGGQREGA